MKSMRLAQLALARSGDKGASANVGVIARSEKAFEFLRGALSAEVVQEFFKRLGVGSVIRYELPNLRAFNFILPKVLDGGGSVSMRIDAQGKALGQILLELPLEVPDDLYDQFLPPRKR
jgi:hypothetical protein